MEVNANKFESQPASRDNTVAAFRATVVNNTQEIVQGQAQNKKHFIARNIVGTYKYSRNSPYTYCYIHIKMSSE